MIKICSRSPWNTTVEFIEMNEILIVESKDAPAALFIVSENLTELTKLVTDSRFRNIGGCRASEPAHLKHDQ